MKVGEEGWRGRRREGNGRGRGKRERKGESIKGGITYRSKKVRLRKRMARVK